MVAFFLLMTLVGAEQFTVSEYNMLYHFNDLSIGTFPYVRRESLFYDFRLDGQVKVFNNIKADLTCVMEWSNNPFTGHYIAPKEELIAGLKDLVPNFADLAAEVKKAFPEVAKCQGLPELKLFDDKSALKDIASEEWKTIKECGVEMRKARVLKRSDVKLIEFLMIADRLTTIDKVDGFDILKAPYKRMVVDKKCGTLLKNGRRPTDLPRGEGSLDKDCATMTSTSMNDLKQAVLFAYDSTKFRETKTVKNVKDDISGIYTAFDDLERGTATQNFVIQEMEYIGGDANPKPDEVNRSNVYYVICSHFKSKSENVVSRKKLGTEIRKFMENNSLLNKNVILMGDFNAEVEEISYSLGMRIARLGDQNVHLPGYTKPQKPSAVTKIFSPNTFFMSKFYGVLHSLDVCEQFMGMMDPMADKSVCFHMIDEIKKKAFKSPWLKDDVDSSMVPYSQTKHLPMWIEANNFSTEKKVRIKEMDYDNEEFLSCLHQKGISTSSTHLSFLKASLGATEEQMNKLEKSLRDKIIAADKDIDKKVAEAKKKDQVMEFTPTQMFKRAMQELTKNEYLEIASSTDNKQKVSDYQECFNHLYEEEKIDFILLRLQHRFNLTTRPYDLPNKPKEGFLEIMKRGMPNELYPSDHMCSFVTITFPSSSADKDKFEHGPIQDRRAREVI